MSRTEHTRRPAPVGLIALTCNEIQRLFTTAVGTDGREEGVGEVTQRDHKLK